MVRSEKEVSVKEIKEILDSNSIFVLLNYKGLTAGEITTLRMNLKDKDSNMKIFKNTLFNKAVAGTTFEFLKDELSEQVALSYSNDPIALSNVLNNFLKDNEKLKVKLVSLDKSKADVSVIKEMAGLGSVDDIRARFIGVLQAAGSQLVAVLNAYKEKLES